MEPNYWKETAAAALALHNMRPMLPSPDCSPEPSAMVETSESSRRPRRSRVSGHASEAESTPQSEVDQHYHAGREIQRSDEGRSLSSHPMDDVPMNVANMVINMYERYSAELSEKKQENDELRAEQEALREKMKEMENRLQMHLVLMDGFVDFMTEVKQGRFTATTDPEVGIARRLGPKHLEMVRGLTRTRQKRPEPSPMLIEDGPLEFSEEAEIDQDLTEIIDHMDIPEPHLVREAWRDLNIIPPTPDTPEMDAAPIRSTGTRAAKRRNPFSAPKRQTRRKITAARRRRNNSDSDSDSDDFSVSEVEYRPMATRSRARNRPKFQSLDIEVPDAEPVSVPEEVDVPASEPEEVLERPRLRPRTAWRAVNVVSPIAEEGEASNRDAEPETPVLSSPVYVEAEAVGDSDYEPEANEPEEQEDDDFEEYNSDGSDSRSPSPVPSEIFEDYHTPERRKSPRSQTPSEPPSPQPNKPRYKAPRRTTERFASGPPGKPFKFCRMPKTIARIWQEYKHGLNGNPAIEALETKYGTGWRMGNLEERKYGSNYVGVRKKIIKAVEEKCEELNMSPDEVLELFDQRYTKRVEHLQNAILAEYDPLTTPFEAIMALKRDKKRPKGLNELFS